MLFCCVYVAGPATFLASDSVLWTLFSPENTKNLYFWLHHLFYTLSIKIQSLTLVSKTTQCPFTETGWNDENTKAHFLLELSKSGFFQYKTNAEGIWRLSQCAEQKQKKKKKKVLDFSRQESFYQLCIPLDVSVERVNTVKRVSKKTREGSRLPLITPPSPISAE